MKTLTQDTPVDLVAEAARALEEARAVAHEARARLDAARASGRPFAVDQAADAVLQADQERARCERAADQARFAARAQAYETEVRELHPLVERKERLLDQAAAIETEIRERRCLVAAEAVLVPGCLSPEAIEHRRRIMATYGFAV